MCKMVIQSKIKIDDFIIEITINYVKNFFENLQSSR